MKLKLSLHQVISAAIFSLLAFVCAAASFAQSVPEKVEVDINTGTEAAWYGQPWIWAVGVAVFIIIIVAITRGGNRNTA